MHRCFRALLLLTIGCSAEQPRPADPITAINKAFATHQLVLLGDLHGSVEEHHRIGTHANLGGMRSSYCASDVETVLLEAANAAVSVAVVIPR